ncbi:MAG: elongation factor 1-beta [archaeon]
MGKMVLIYRIAPEDMEEIKRIENEIKDKVNRLGELRDMKREPIAFGLEAIKIAIVTEAKGTEGITEKIEQALNAIKGVSSVENIGMNLL